MANLSQLKEQVLGSQKRQWLISDGKMDHGPFTGAELLEKLESGQFSSHFTVQNLITSEKPTVISRHPVWGPLEGKTLRTKTQEEQKKLRIQQQKNKRKNFFLKMAFLVFISGGTFAATHYAPYNLMHFIFTTPSNLPHAHTKRIEPPTKQTVTSSHKKTPQKLSQNVNVETTSFEQGMQNAIEFQNFKGKSSEEILSSTKVTKILDQKIRKFQRCFLKLPNHGKGLGNIPIDIAIGGNGRVLGVSTRKGNEKFKNCVNATITRIRFPRFSSPRMTAHYSLYSE